jgi:hypothetical protein
MKALHPHSTASYREEQSAGRTRSFRRRVYDAIALTTLTDRQIMAGLEETDPNNIRPEITRLKQDGLIREVGKVRCEYTGKTVRQVTTTGKPYFDRGAEIKTFFPPPPMLNLKEMIDQATLL